MSTEKDKPWWWPTLTDESWLAQIREDYPETADMSDNALIEYYADGRKYATTWDHVGDARADHEELADAFLKLVEETGKTPADFLRRPDKQE